MGETVGAITYKTDLKSRTRDKVSDTKDKITGKASDVKDRVTGTVSSATDALPGGGSGGGGSEGGGLSAAKDRISSATPDAQEVKYKARRAASVAQQNPLGLAIGSLALGFLAGSLIPSTDVENEKIGPIADQIKEEAQNVGHEALERGKAVAAQAQEAASSAMQASQDAKSVAGEATGQAQGFKESVKESAQNVQSTAQSAAKS
jgi:methyl-accepting chemotaxis protein